MPPATYLDRRSPPHITTLVIAAAFAAGTMSIILPALPAISEEFDADPAVVQLAMSLYLATTAGLQIFIGPLSDRFGRRSIMLSCFLVAMVATLLAIVAPTIEWLLAARMVQGVAVAGMVVGRAAVRDMLAPAKAASMIAYITMGMTIAPMIGPSIGGFLVEYFGWSAAFWLIFCVGLLALLLIWLDWGETNFDTSSSLTQQFRSYPELFASRRFWGYALTAGFGAGAFFSLIGGGPFLAATYYGLPPSANGLVFLFPTFGYLVGNFVSGRFATRFGINRMILYGGTVLVLCLAISGALVRGGMDDLFLFFGSTTFLGLANGLTMPSAIAGFVSVRRHLAGAASGLGGCIQIGIGAALAAFAAAVLVPENGPFVLIAIMFSSAVCALAATLYVIRIGGLEGPKDDTTTL